MTQDDPTPETSEQALQERRGYTSSLRQQRAERTRSKIAEAAGELFAETGFAGTTIAAIAARAGVAVPTVYAVFGSKAAILGALLEGFEEAAEASQWRDRIATETDPAQILQAFAQWQRAFFVSSEATMTAAREAVTDPRIAELADLGNAHRRAALDRLIGRLADTGALLPGLSRQEAVDRAWLLTGIELYLAATRGCGWSPEQYADWLGRSLVQQVLAADR
jgi:AcrR family transcriptional regulator